MPPGYFVRETLKVKLAFALSSKATNFELPHTYQNILYSEATGLIDPNFHLKYSLDEKQYKYDICIRSLDQNGCNVHIK